MAETTTATSLPRATSALTLRASFLIRSISPTDVPPNLTRMRAMNLLEGQASARKAGYRHRRRHMGQGSAMSQTTHPSHTSTVDPAEVERFSRIAEEWWDPTGKFAPLHRLGPVRIGYLRDRAAAHWGREALSGQPL